MKMTRQELKSLQNQLHYHRQQVKDLEAKLPKINYQTIIRITCKVMNTTKEQMLTRYTHGRISDARIIAAKEMRLYGITTVTIGAILERDHTTIIYYCDKYDDLYRHNPAFRTKADLVAAAIDAHIHPQIKAIA